MLSSEETEFSGRSEFSFDGCSDDCTELLLSENVVSVFPAQAARDKTMNANRKRTNNFLDVLALVMRYPPFIFDR